jgi:putative spermidine/putrescine transport system permease protein
MASITQDAVMPAAGSQPKHRLTRGVVFRWAALILLMVWLVAPMIPLFIWSVSFRWFFPDILPSQLSSRAWEYVFSPTSGTLRALWDTTVIAAAVTVISILVGVPAGRALGMHQFRGKRLVELLMLAPTIVPGLAVILGIHVVFIRMGLADTLLGVVLVHLIPTLPYMVLVMAGVFANYQPEFEEQARSLGADPVRTLWYVMIPAILPGVIVGGLFVFLISWSQYILTLLIGGGQVLTLPMLLFNFASSGDNAMTGALSVVFVLPGILIMLFTSRFLTGENAAAGGLGRFQ